MEEIINYLFENNIINKKEYETLKSFLIILKEENIYRYILEKGYLKEDKLLKLLQENYNTNSIIPYYLINKLEIVSNIFKNFNIKNKEYNIIIVKINTEYFKNLQKNIKEIEKVNEIKNIIKNKNGYFLLTYNPSYIKENNIEKEIEKLIGQKLVLNIIDINNYKNLLHNYFIKNYQKKLEEDFIKLNQKDIIITENLVENFLNNLINFNIYNKSNYIHIENNNIFISIRNKKNNIINYLGSLKSNLFLNIQKIINNMLELSQKKLLPNETLDKNLINFNNEIFKNLKLKVIKNNNNISLKIEHEFNEIISFETLNYTSKDIENFNKILNIRNGIILITGSKNNGRKILFNSFINKISSPFKKTIVNKNSLKTDNLFIQKENIDFTKINNIDYDLLCYGEILKDKELENLFELSTQGNLIIGILKFNNILNTLTYLNENYQLNKLINNLKAIIAQKTVRKLCNNCKIKLTEEETLTKQIYINYGLSDIEVYEHNPEGCNECNFIGYKKIIPLTEMIIFDKNIQLSIIEEKNISNIMSSIESNGFKNFQTKLKELITKGETDIYELDRIIGLDIVNEEFEY